MIVEEFFKGIPEDMYLSDASQPWVLNLIGAINTASASDDAEDAVIQRLTVNSNGKELRTAFRALPARIQVSILNDIIVSYGNRRRRDSDKIEEEKAHLEIMEKKLKHNLIKFGAYGFMVMSFLIVIGIILISWKQNTTPDASIATGLFSTVVEIIKIIFSIN